jgi:hypothetical protein
LLFAIAATKSRNESEIASGQFHPTFVNVFALARDSKSDSMPARYHNEKTTCGGPDWVPSSSSQSDIARHVIAWREVEVLQNLIQDAPSGICRSSKIKSGFGPGS